MIKVLAIGDVVGDGGRAFLRKKLPAFKRENNIDICIVNGENSAQGNGITEQSASDLLTGGADVITTGNHVYRRREIYSVFSDNFPMIRPANYPLDAPGRGYYILDMGRYSLAVVNLMGTVYLDNLDNPFNVIDNILRELSPVKNIILDFHAEATSEKRAMGFYLDSKVTAVFGTHTHVPTADAQILPGGTGYITDIGMTGAVDSVLGVTPGNVIEKFKTNMPVRFTNPDSQCKMEGCIFVINEKTGKTTDIKQIAVY